MTMLQQLIDLAQKLDFKTQKELRELEDIIVNEHGIFINMLSMIKTHMKYIQLTSLPFTLTNRVNNIVNVWNCSDCNECGDRVIYRRTVGTGNINAKYVIIGDAPGVGDGAKDNIDRALVYGVSSHKLRKALIECGVIHDCWFTNLLKCAKKDNEPSKITDVIACRKYLNDELFMVEPYRIILLGNHVEKMFKALYPTVTIDTVKIYHPAYIVRMGISSHNYAKMIRRVL